ncbi:MAG: 4Fe-4S binding protein [Lachnospiraceae bacterium]|nr:4Fe-4S binding protein [Lachnospiraceae bacterium]
MPFIDRSGKRGRFTECVGCRSCEQHCPQGIAIPDVMSELQAVFAGL